jgi:hypothetical protein
MKVCCSGVALLLSEVLRKHYLLSDELLVLFWLVLKFDYIFSSRFYFCNLLSRKKVHLLKINPIIVYVIFIDVILFFWFCNGFYNSSLWKPSVFLLQIESCFHKKKRGTINPLWNSITQTTYDNPSGKLTACNQSIQPEFHCSFAVNEILAVTSCFNLQLEFILFPKDI